MSGAPPVGDEAVSPAGLLGGTAGSLKRYRVLAFCVGTGLAILCFVGIPLQVIGHYSDHVGGSVLSSKWPWTAVVGIVGPVHGILYIVYLLSCLDLAGRARFRVVQLLGMVGAGLLPGLAFYMERKVAQRVKAELALGAEAPPGPAATFWAVVSGRARSAVEAEPGADGG